MDDLSSCGSVRKVGKMTAENWPVFLARFPGLAKPKSVTLTYIYSTTTMHIVFKLKRVRKKNLLPVYAKANSLYGGICCGRTHSLCCTCTSTENQCVWSCEGQ
jgi:hypothetical protein